MVQKSSFLYDENGKYYCADTGRIITGKNLKYILAFLNSELFFFAVKHFYGGGGLGETGVRMKHTFFENFSISKLNKHKQKPFERIVTQIISDKKANKDTTALEQQIDNKVYKLYGLTYEEVLIVQPDFTEVMSKKEYDAFEIIK